MRFLSNQNKEMQMFLAQPKRVSHLSNRVCARARLSELFKSTPCVPIVFRLAWDDASTYCADTRTGGSTGSIRFALKALHGVDNEQKIVHDLLSSIKSAHPDVSYADLSQPAAVVGVKLAGGPVDHDPPGFYRRRHVLCQDEDR